MGRKKMVKKQTNAEQLPQLPQDKTKEKYFEIFTFFLLLLFGIYHGILYYGHQIVPNPDFICFIESGRSLLSFQLPETLKRAPLFGISQVALSRIVGGPHPELTAGWLLNCIFHPLNVVLLWLVGRRIVGRVALWLTIIIVVNLWLIRSLAQPIAETMLLFFFLLSFYLILKRSSLCYLTVSMATIVRYEGAVLIFLAFVVDIIYHKDKRRRMLALLYSALASVPFALWMLATILRCNLEGSGSYLTEFGAFVGGKNLWPAYIKTTWQTAFYPLFMPIPTASSQTTILLFNLSKLIASLSLVFAVIYALCKRHWDILALPCFLVTSA